MNTEISSAPPTLVIGNKNYSSWSLRPWLVLQHYGIRFEEVRLLLDTDAFFKDIGRYSPTGKVPALWDGDWHIWDSLAICEYINERWLNGGGWPSELKTRAEARTVVAEMHSGFAALRKQLPMNCSRIPSAPHWDEHAQADIDRIQTIWTDLRQRHCQQGAFLFGEFSIADAMFAPVVIRLHHYGATVNSEVQQYMQTIRELPAMQAWYKAALAETERMETTDNLGKM